MKFRISAVLLLFFTAFTNVLLAQNGFRAGTIITVNGDTIHGLINRQTRRYSPKSIIFKKLDNASSETLTPFQIKSFVIENNDEYIAYVGPVSTNPVGFNTAVIQTDTTVRQDTSFLFVVSSGPNVKLLRHQDEIKTAYFIKEKDKLPQELKFYSYVDNISKELVADRQYLRQLYVILQHYQVVSNLRFNSQGQVDYDENSLIKYVNLINYDPLAPRKPSTGRFYMGAGATFLKFSFDAPKDFKNGTPSANTSPMFNIGVDILLNNRTKKTNMRIEGSVWRATANYSFYAGIFDYDMVVASIKPQFMYSFYKGRAFNIYIGAGGGINLPVELKNVLTPTPGWAFISPSTSRGGAATSQTGAPISDPYYKLSAFFTGEVKFGVVVGGKVELAFSGAAFTTTSTGYNYAYLKPYSAGINYFFGKPRQ